MSIFSTMLELHFSGLKSILFYPEDQKMFLSGFLCSKEKIRKRSIFWEIPWTNPFAKCRFFRLFRTSLLRSKKYSFLSRIWKNLSFWLFWLKKKHMKKRSIFAQKPWTNPFAKWRFFLTLWKLHFWGPKNFFSIQNIKKCFFMAFLLEKKHIRKMSIFWQNHELTPLQNVDLFLECFRSFLLWSKKHSFLSRISKNVSLWLFFAQKKTYEIRSIFWQKPWTNPLAKCRYSLTLLELHFSGLKSILFYQEYKKMFLSCFFCSKKT